MMRGNLLLVTVGMVVLVVAGQSTVVAYQPCGSIACPAVYDPVCGSDGQTYSSVCSLGIAQCRDRSLKFLHDGECTTVLASPPCYNPHCFENYDPLCGTDGITYDNKCYFNNAKCRNPRLRIRNRGECVDCPGICTLEYEPVCGTDWVTYGNECQLRAARVCDNKPYLTIARKGEC